MAATKKLNYMEIAHLTSGLRILQEIVEKSEIEKVMHLPSFDGVDPFTTEQIDSLCDLLNSNDICIK